MLWAGSTEYCGEVIIARSPEYGKMLFTDGELQSSEYDEAVYHEHLVHPPVLAYLAAFGVPSRPLSVLVLGAGEGATVRELLKYPTSTIGHVTWCDIDSDLCTLCREHLAYVNSKDDASVYANPSRAVLVYDDANVLLADTSAPLYDIVICDLPDPVCGDQSGLYSDAFWAAVHGRTAANAIVGTHCGPVAPGAENLETMEFCSGGMRSAGFGRTLFGKVGVPSFQSEWGYLIAKKGGDIKYDGAKWGENKPTGLRILDDEALQAFFCVPRFYYNYPYPRDYEESKGSETKAEEKR